MVGVANWLVWGRGSVVTSLMEFVLLEAQFSSHLGSTMKYIVRFGNVVTRTQLVIHKESVTMLSINSSSLVLNYIIIYTTPTGELPSQSSD